MARISTYGNDAKPSLGDKVIGTDTSAGANFATKNYSLYEVIQMFNELNTLAVADQVLFELQTDITDGRNAGTISFEAGGGQNTAFSAITELMVSKTAPGSKNVTNWLNLFAGGDIIIAESGNINNYGTFHVESIEEHDTETAFYVVTLTNLASNGSLAIDGHYIFSEFADPNKVGDLSYTHNQPSPSATWNIQHNLNKFPSVTSVNINNIEVKGEIEYTDLNNLTVKFSAGFSGKAYLN